MTLSAYCGESLLAGDLITDNIKYLLSVVTIHQIFKPPIQQNFPCLPSQTVIRKLGKVRMFQKSFVSAACEMQIAIWSGLSLPIILQKFFRVDANIK